VTRRGFSLLELVTVLLILGVVAGVTVPRLSRDAEISPVEEAASNLATLLRVAHRSALESAGHVTVRLVKGAWTITRAAGDSVAPLDSGVLRLPPGVTIPGDSAGVSFRFFPYGGAEGDTVYALSADGAAVAVFVNRWTGEPHVSR
jgi:prepilin-type N-terminal cleavage/methylation domain-containing protein